MFKQLTLFEESVEDLPNPKKLRSGTFVDNMSLPIHRWFRYSAGFAALWVEEVLANWQIEPGQVVLDPFVGSGTVSIVCDSTGIDSIGVEAHPVVARICKAKLLWDCHPTQFEQFAAGMLEHARRSIANVHSYPPLIQQSFELEALQTLDRLRSAWISMQNSSPESELAWLARTSTLRKASKAGTAQWQYILPRKTKKKVLHPLLAFEQQVQLMKQDMKWMQAKLESSRARVIAGDARTIGTSIQDKVDAVVTSPPYANNYDYADALRFEMTFWGEVSGWGDIHDAVRKHLIVSSSQHASREKLKVNTLLESDAVQPIRYELGLVMQTLSEVRASHGGKKHYHTMIGAYCRDISLILRQLRVACKDGAKMCWVIGDSAPYGVYCPIDKWIGELAVAAGFKQYRFEKLRERNTKWKNRKHRVPLKEGLLWIEG